MGLLTRFLGQNAVRLASVILRSPELFTESERQLNLSSGNLALGEEEERKQRQRIKALYYLSLFAEIVDLINSILDLIFTAFLFGLPDSTLYGIILITGIILGRAAVFRGSYVLFRNGIDWNPFWIESEEETSRGLKLLHCLFFTEFAVFLLEDFPSLVIYGHWQTINTPPAPLRMADNVNVAVTVVALATVTILMLTSICVALYKMDFASWSTKEKVINSGKVLVFLTLCGLLLRFVLLSMEEAFAFTLLDDRILPENKLLGSIPICDEVTLATNTQYCDEKSFLVRVAIAWTAAFGLCYYLLFRVASPLDQVPYTNKLGALATGRDDNKSAAPGGPDPDTTSTHVADPSNADDDDGKDRDSPV